MLRIIALAILHITLAMLHGTISNATYHCISYATYFGISNAT
jgi:hypothetical protein